MVRSGSKYWVGFMVGNARSVPGVQGSKLLVPGSRFRVFQVQGRVRLADDSVHTNQSG